ncbi:MAG TPA: ATP-binding protein [Candidatus Polarisedimenticolaceae bacterium]|nr:ATP-binding protein [Candidatus Polarisedimenticolaceae bacterium]
MSPNSRPVPGESFRLQPEQLRWRCDPESFGFKLSEELGDEASIQVIGQPRALESLRLGLQVQSEGFNIFVSGEVGGGRSSVVRRMLGEVERGGTAPQDLVYVYNFRETDEPCMLRFPAGKGRAFRRAMRELIGALHRALPRLFESESYRKTRTARIETSTTLQKARLREFEKRVQEDGFALVQVQLGPLLVRPQIFPLMAGNPVEMSQLEALVDEGKYQRKEFEAQEKKLVRLRSELETLGKQLRQMDRELRAELVKLDRELGQPLVAEAIAEIREEFDAEGLAPYLEQVAENLLDGIETFHESGEPTPETPVPRSSERPPHDPRYEVNVLVDNSQTQGKPIIWETTPSYRNVFGAIEKARREGGEWETDHTRIRAGSLLRANGGYLVLDAIDVLTEPGVWATLKRTLRTRQLEIQSFDPLYLFTGLAIKPQPVPIDVKVVMIGTPLIYRLLYHLDEDFKKIFKIKAEFAQHTSRDEQELQNYARFIHKKCRDDALPPFHRDAVATVVEYGVRLAGHHDKLTTRFTDIADVVREAAYWARRDKARHVRVEHVDRAVASRTYRVNLYEELGREQIVEGTVLLDVVGERVGQVNALAVLDVGDHLFAQPSRITATTAMGRAGIIAIDREAEMSGSIHTKGVLILAGFLRSRFAQNKPLTLTASLCFEQSYAGIEGDSASSSELYALLSSLSRVPIRQGIAVTGSVNQLGEIQPIGGINEKVEGFFDLCSRQGLGGEQGVMIPYRNLPHLMLRKDVVEAVRRGRFHVWAVSTIEQGIEVLTGLPAGERANDGSYPDATVFGRVDDELARLARELLAFGPADAGAR